MADNTLPQIKTIEEVAEYLRVDKEIVVREIESGRLHGFKIGQQWRCSDDDLLAYIGEVGAMAEAPQIQLAQTKTYNQTWNIVETEPFDFSWPKKGGGGYVEHYDRCYQATKVLDGQQYDFKIGFGNREVAGQMRRRVTIWLGYRAVVEFAGSNDYENDGLLAGVIRLRNGKQLSNTRVPDEYKGFKVGKYNSIVRGPRASKGMAVIVHRDDLRSMLDHAVIRAIWKELM